ncbi:MAG: hypothetical protein R3C14_48360 [Caldilineaceae bacterium]
MLATVEGIYRDGKVELKEVPTEIIDSVSNEIRVIVTFLPSPSIDLRRRGIDETAAAELRARLLPFAADWEQPEMDLYDDYESVQPSLSSR